MISTQFDHVFESDQNSADTSDTTIITIYRPTSNVVVLSTLTVKQEKSVRLPSVWRDAGLHHDNDGETKTQLKML